MGAVVTSSGVDGTPDALMAELRTAGYRVGSPRPVTRTVLDSFDGRLHTAGLRLDHTDGSLVLLDTAGGAAHLAVTDVPRFVTDLPPGPFRDRLTQELEVRALLPVTTIESTARRAERRNGDQKLTSVVTVEELVRVEGAPLDGWFASVDQLTGYAKPADQASDIVARHTADARPGDAVEVALAVARLDRAGQRIDIGIPLDPEQPALEGFRLVLANLDDAIELNRPGTIEDLDSEFLHDLRVAVRRSRSIIRHGRSVLPTALLGWAVPGLKLVGDVTSPPRDFDVQLLEWDRSVAALDEEARRALDPLHVQLSRDRDAAHVELTAQLRAGEAADVLRRWNEVVHGRMAVEEGGDRAGDPLLDVVRRRVTKAQRRLLDHGRAITPDTPAEPVHEVRKDAKRLRYLLECFADLFPSDQRKDFVRRLKRLQELLGEHQDAAVHAAELRHVADELPAGTEPATYLAVGQLIEHLERVRQDARDGFAERFAEYDSRPTRRALRDMLDGAAR